MFAGSSDGSLDKGFCLRPGLYSHDFSGKTVGSVIGHDDLDFQHCNWCVEARRKPLPQCANWHWVPLHHQHGHHERRGLFRVEV